MSTDAQIDVFLRAAAAGLIADSSMAGAATSGHRGEAGRGREGAIRRAFESGLPRRVAVKTGFVLGVEGLNKSNQLDIILYDADHFPTFPYDESSNSGLLIPDGVFGVISVRTYLRSPEVVDHFKAARAFKSLMREALGTEWPGFFAVLGFQLEGAAAVVDRFYEQLKVGPKRGGVDLLAAIDSGPMCLDLATFGAGQLPPESLAQARRPPEFLANRAHYLGIEYDACHADATDPFVDFYKLILLALDAPRLRRVVEMAAPAPDIAVLEGLTADARYEAAFAGKSADLDLQPGQAGYFVIFYANVGSIEWVRDSESEVDFVVAGPQGYVTPKGWLRDWASPSIYCRQQQPIVRPGQIATFPFAVTVPLNAKPGSYRFFGRPANAAAGALAPETRASVVTVGPSD